MKYSKLLKLAATLSIIAFIGNTAFAQIGNDAKLQYNKGLDYYQLGQYTQAAESFRQAISLDPNYIDAYYNLGALMEYLGKNEDALNAFKQIILRKPEDYESVYKAAEISKRIGQSDKALMYLTLIPQDSIIGQKSTMLTNSIKSDMEIAKQKAQEEIQAQEQTQEENVQNSVKNAVEQTKNAISNIKEQVQTLKQAAFTQEQQQTNETAVSTPADNPEKPVASVINYNNISSPTGIVTDSSGNLYVAGFSDNTIYKIGPDNKKIVYIKSPKIDGPIGLAMDKSGNIYIANYNKNNVLKVGSSGEISELLTDIKNPYCMYITDSYLYVSSQGNNSVVKFKLQ